MGIANWEDPGQDWNARPSQFNVWALTWTGNPFSGAERVFLGGGQFLIFSDFKISRLSWIFILVKNAGGRDQPQEF